MIRPNATLIFTLAFFALAPLTAAATVVISTVPVGNPGNPNDPHGSYDGAVAYDYRIGTYEVTVGQYTEFLNAVAATDTYALYNPYMTSAVQIAGISRSGGVGNYSYGVIGSPNKPVANVNWGDAARFANWLHNGQPKGPQSASTTEDGAYTLNGAITESALYAVSRNAGAQWFIPTAAEWYKAAYYQPAAQGGDTDGYWAWATRTNSTPYSDQPPGIDAPVQSNTANFLQDDGIANGYDDGYAVTGLPYGSIAQNYLTDVGAYTASVSPYGAFDMMGNVDEWTDTTASLRYRYVMGGSYRDISRDFESVTRKLIPPSNEVLIFSVGFRVATVPEPNSIVLAFFAIFGTFAFSRRRLKRGASESSPAAN